MISGRYLEHTIVNNQLLLELSQKDRLYRGNIHYGANFLTAKGLFQHFATGRLTANEGQNLNFVQVFLGRRSC